ncbi:MAG: hypothetical protein LRY27_03030 [Chitinophagales bacterium]|nr:hypothetical protein [Chitinophagales bacterium]
MIVKTKISFLIFLFIVLISSCKKDKPCNDCLFGIPNIRTGLSVEKCKPFCETQGFQSKTFTQQELDILKSCTNTQPFAELTSNPYTEQIPNTQDYVCAVVVDDLNAKLYHVENFESPQAALEAGAYLTHYDGCGKCSTLQDFTVYAENIDIGFDVRNCAIMHLNSPLDSLVLCIENLGFTKPCAQIWAYNTKNTQQHCFSVCIQDTAYNKPDGSLSNCLQCDETHSGPVFKAIAGRTRRNTGIASSICRFCTEAKPVEHNYPFK